MTSNVYFSSIRTRKHADSKIAKIARLCDAVGLSDVVHKGDLTAIKLHFGEYGNDTYLNPTFARAVVDKVLAAGGKPFLTDTTTLYSGSRSNAIDHLSTAYGHGFSPSTVNAPVIIADGLLGLNDELVDVDLKHFKQVHIATEIRRASSMVVLSHFKGHEMAGFGGAIKNLAMGCASVPGKRDQHATKVLTQDALCIGCGQCTKICPQHAITLGADKKAHIDTAQCIGCFECITVCQPKALAIDWATQLPAFVERLTEYAYGAVHNKRVCYLNFVLNVTPDCDCAAWSDAPLVQDIGLLASNDPVALDMACFDLVKAEQSLSVHGHTAGHTGHGPGLDTGPEGQTSNGVGVDKFTARWKNTVGLMQITYGESIGLGSSDYNLITI